MVNKDEASERSHAKPDFVVFDLETTGFDVREHEIIEIGAVRVSADLTTIRGTFEERIRPERIEKAMPESLVVNGYTTEGWQTAKGTEETLRAFCAFARGGMLAAYNITFDWAFLQMALLTHTIEPTFEYHRFDIFSLAYEFVVTAGGTGMKLKEMCARFNIPLPSEPHRALADAQAALAVFEAIRS